MGLSYEEALQQARAIGAGASVSVVVATNQENGIVSYMTGTLTYYPQRIVGWAFMPEKLSSGANAFKVLFSDRTEPWGTPPTEGFDTRPRQPFAVAHEDKIGLSISKAVFSPSQAVTAKFTLLSWGNATYQVSLQVIDKLLYGMGAPVGDRASEALYTISFTGVHPPFVPPH